MNPKLTATTLAAASALFLSAGTARAQISGDVIRIGLITDMSGLYADLDGAGGVEAVKMAIADAGGKVNGKTVEFVVADHQNKPDIAAAKAREWFDTQGLDMLLGGANSGTNLAMAKVATEKKKPFISLGAASAALTNEQCSPYIIHYAYDTVALAKGTGNAVVKSGGKTWYFLTADYAFGTQLQNDTTEVVKAANEFGITKSMKLAGLLLFITDVHALGLKATQGLYLTDGWYWDQSPEARTWARRYFGVMKKMPSMVQAGDYSATAQYLNAVKATGTDDGDRIMAHFKSTKINDMFAKNGYVRADGRMVHDMFLMQVKKPEESKAPWDYYRIVETIKGDDAYTTKAESKCPLWK